jgi:hypothetical protein
MREAPPVMRRLSASLQIAVALSSTSPVVAADANGVLGDSQP